MVDKKTIANTPSVGTATVATLLSSNVGRSGFSIQNHGTNPLFIALGIQAANTVTFHIILNGGTAVEDGKGGIYSQSGGSCYTGAIYASGTAPTYTVAEW